MSSKKFNNVTYFAFLRFYMYIFSVKVLNNQYSNPRIGRRSIGQSEVDLAPLTYSVWGGNMRSPVVNNSCVPYIDKLQVCKANVANKLPESHF